MKQKVVIKVTINGQKSRPKVMKIVVGSSGVESVAWIGDDKNQIEVIGDGLDPSVLTLMLRKKLGYADLVSVEEKKEEKKDEKKDEKKENEAKLQETAMPACSCYGSWPYCEATQVVRDPYYGPWPYCEVTQVIRDPYYGLWPYCEAIQVVRDPYYGSWP